MRFRKAQCPIVERLVNALMMHGTIFFSLFFFFETLKNFVGFFIIHPIGRNSGKKLLAVKIVKHAFEIIHLLTGENPIQVLTSAIVNGIYCYVSLGFFFFIL